MLKLVFLPRFPTHSVRFSITKLTSKVTLEVTEAVNPSRWFKTTSRLIRIKVVITIESGSTFHAIEIYAEGFDNKSILKKVEFSSSLCINSTWVTLWKLLSQPKWTRSGPPSKAHVRLSPPFPGPLSIRICNEYQRQFHQSNISYNNRSLVNRTQRTQIHRAWFPEHKKAKGKKKKKRKIRRFSGPSISQRVKLTPNAFFHMSVPIGME